MLKDLETLKAEIRPFEVTPRLTNLELLEYLDFMSHEAPEIRYLYGPTVGPESD